MKRVITLAILAVCMIISCTKFDDSAIWDKLNDHESRIAYLEEVCKKMNTDIVNLQTIVTALETNDYIVNASPLATGDGYTFLFKSGKSIVVYNGKDGSNGTDGKDGKDGKDGITPTIGVMKDVDGVYYWTVNGEWLLVNGQKVKASATDGKDGENGENGKDGITPKFKIEEEYWYVSYDNGVSWEKLGKATGEDGQNGTNGIDGDSIFSQVKQDDEFVYFYLANGTMITLPKHNTDVIHFEDLRVKAICCKNWDEDNDGELSYAEAAAVTSIGTKFARNTNIISFKELKYFTGLIEIQDEAFYECSSLWKVEIPQNVMFIGKRAFYKCDALYKIELPNGLISIGGSAFYNCSSITHINVPDTVVEIGGSAFSSCTGLKKVTIPKSVVSIGSSAFSYCTGELYIDCNMPNYTTNIGTPLSHSHFSTIIIGENVTSIGNYYFTFCDSLTNVIMSDSITSIGWNAFEYCDVLTNVIMSKNITTIGGYAFKDCAALTSITIPEKVTLIDCDAFKGCSSLQEAFCKPIDPPVLDFSGSETCVFPFNSNLKIYIPRDSYSLYINYKPPYSSYYSWAKYKNYFIPYDFK